MLLFLLLLLNKSLPIFDFGMMGGGQTGSMTRLPLGSLLTGTVGGRGELMGKTEKHPPPPLSVDAPPSGKALSERPLSQTRG